MANIELSHIIHSDLKTGGLKPNGLINSYRLMGAHDAYMPHWLVRVSPLDYYM